MTQFRLDLYEIQDASPLCEDCLTPLLNLKPVGAIHCEVFCDGWGDAGIGDRDIRISQNLNTFPR